MRGVTPLRSIRICSNVPTISVPILKSHGAHAPYRTNNCLYRHTTRRKQKLKLRMIRSVRFHACGPNPRDTNNALRLCSRNSKAVSNIWICRPSTSLQRLIRLDCVNRRHRFSMKKPLRSSARGASCHTKQASNVNVVRVVLLDANSYLAYW
jgi:hypothetical protein